MCKAGSRFRWMGLAVIVSIVALYGVCVQGAARQSENTPVPRADVIFIDGLKTFGDLERPPVTFLHAKHTDALGKKNEDCLACHPVEKERLSPKFMRLSDPDRETVMNVYHDNCIACHRETRSAGEKSGPATCGECHPKTTTVVSVRQPMGMDKSLHYRHVKAFDNKCEQCHHEYDAKAKKLFYAKGKEGTCRYCHRQQTEENRISMRLASHFSCVDCHRKRVAKKKSAGPNDCNSCHEDKSQQMIEKVENLPRMARQQPDTVFVKIGAPSDNPTGSAMNPVPFNHKAHERANDTCRACHHESLNACSQCHTLTGAKEGGGVKLEQAMHKAGSQQSCLGCHLIKQQTAECAGCHGAMVKQQRPAAASCVDCHQKLPPGLSGTVADPADKRLAREMLDQRRRVAGTYDKADIPQKVVINVLSDKFDMVEFPHRKIVSALAKNIEDNQMAAYFHQDPGTLCQGCHHNSPPARKPPSCGSCHGRAFDPRSLHKPGLMGAYHQQCLGCHVRMNIAKPDSRDCIACHIEKKQW